MPHNKINLRLSFVVMVFIDLMLSSCEQLNENYLPTTETSSFSNESTVTIDSQKNLTICVGSEPESLFIYSQSTQSMWSILESIYDGPIDIIDYQPIPIIISSIPSIENGGVIVQSVPVRGGDLVANTEGKIVELQKGVKVYPEGCLSSSCIIEWDGSSYLNVVQMVVNFTLLPNIKWSDGYPLIAADSVFSYQVARDPSTKVTSTRLNQTASYIALDERTIQWIGTPGYLSLNTASFFWIPIPKHQLGNLPISELSTLEVTKHKPLGWGPYILAEWVIGEKVTLVRNPNYFRTAEGLPYYDTVTYKFIGNIPEVDLSFIVTGECDIIDTSVSMKDNWRAVHTAEQGGYIRAYYSQGSRWEGLNFGIRSRSYDDGYTLGQDRTDFFGDVRTRQAIAHCINRDRIIKMWVYSSGDVPTSYLPKNHPFYIDTLPTYKYDKERGKLLLDEVGWIDDDKDPSTPRIAAGISNVLDNTEFIINYYASNSVLHANIAEYIQEDLSACGIKMNVVLLPIEDIYAPGPQGFLFGRNFDLAQIGWKTGYQPPCFLYSSTEIPSDYNNWNGLKYGGFNITGYTNRSYDKACNNQLSSGLDREAMLTANEEVLTTLANDLPVLPLFYDIDIMVTRPDLYGLYLSPSSRSGLNYIEEVRPK